MRNDIKVKSVRGEEVFAAAQNALCVGKRESSPGPGSVRKKAKKKGETEKSPSKASRIVGWAREEKRTAEPGDMPLMPPFHDTRF